MDSESLEVTASHIDRLRAIAIPAVADHSSYRGHGHGILHRNSQDSELNNASKLSEYVHQCDSDADLPSVVQESQHIIDTETQCLDCPNLPPPATVKDLQAMASQRDPANGTQLISQSFYDSIIKKGRSTRHGYQDEQSDTQRSYEQGESGHVDITSSFVTRHEQPEDLADSEPVDFSPVPSPDLSRQYPESQRFKTPATAGKKRTYNGEVIDTPAVVRNPLARGGQLTPSETLGLSQAFAATQAASSPFSNGLPTGPRSDRPSPNIELQPRPTSAASSSPLLRPITDLRRAATEPATRYVPMKHSQAERERQERLLVQKEHLDSAYDDGFEEEDSSLTRKRRYRARVQNARQELKTLSSPLASARDLPTSSPPKMTLNEKGNVGYAQSLPTASPSDIDDLLVNGVTVEPASEAETEQDEEEDIDDERSSHSDPEEDKENNSSVLVPKTGPRQKTSFAISIQQVDASPSLRYTNQSVITPAATEVHSSDPFRVMDSQPSQSRAHSKAPPNFATSSASDVVGSVGQSSNTKDENAGAKETAYRTVLTSSADGDAGKTGTEWLEDEVEVVAHAVESGVTTMRDNTVPETNSDLREGQCRNSSSGCNNGNLNAESTATTRTNFETAPMLQEPNTMLQSSQVSSPVRTTPPGRKRRRMMEISAEPSPHKSQSQRSFDAEAILKLDDDCATADLLGATLNKKMMLGSGELVADHRIIELSEVHRAKPSAPDISDTIPDLSQDIVRPGRKSRLQSQNDNFSEQYGQSNVLSSTRRPSIFDLQASQEQPVPTQPLESSLMATKTSSKRKPLKSNRYESRIEKRLQQEVHKDKKLALNNQDSSNVPSTDDVSSDLSETTSCNGILQEPIVASHMVLAYYRGDPRGYYPARVLGLASNGGYEIQWDGYDPEEVDAYGVKALDLRPGDTVKILADGFTKIPYTIQDFKDKSSEEEDVITDIRGYKTLVVVPKQRKSLPATKNIKPVQKVPVSSVYLDTNMWAQLKSRGQDFRPLAKSVTTSGVTTPLIRASTPNTPSSRNRRPTTTFIPTSITAMGGMLDNMAFAISYEDTVEKNTLSSLVQANGGMIVPDSFDDLLEPDTFQLKAQYANVGFTALLADRHSRKEKYMQALSMGLPCLSGKWVEACTKQSELADWHTYLLPAGESAELDNATRSRVLPPINIKTIKLSEILQARPTHFGETAIAIVIGRGKAETKRAPYLFLLQALGARQIYKFSDLKSAKDFLDTAQGKTCQWVFVDDKDVSAFTNLVQDASTVKRVRGRPKSKRPDATEALSYRVAGNELIVQSLILGKLYDA